jgi:hypothetical protein
MKQSRRAFVKNLSLTALLITAGGIKIISGEELNPYRKKIKLRFAIASDGHYGQPDTASDEFYTGITKAINLFHQEQHLQFCIINGDIIHNEKEFLGRSKILLDHLAMPYYVSKGNHDMVNDSYWKEVWATDPNHTITFKKNTFIIANTSNEKGEYLSPDLVWLKQELDAAQNQQNVFLILHIPQFKWTANAIDTPGFFELIKNYKNIKAVFHGHEHDQDGVKMMDDIPCLFDAHFGGNWGTAYRGFRVVELMKDNSMITYIMNPFAKINALEYG